MLVFTTFITIGVNTSPFAGTEGKKLTSRMIRDRLYEEEKSNATAIKINDTDSSETFGVYSLSEKQLIALVEKMRHEGFELTVSKPQCVFRRDENDANKLLEPYEEVVIDAPFNYSGKVVDELCSRSGSLVSMYEFDPDEEIETGMVRTVFHAQTRLLRGLDRSIADSTRGFAIINRSFLKYDKVTNFNIDDLIYRRGSLISSETGEVVGYALSELQDRGVFYVKPQDKVYAGMIIGENFRNEDMEINVTNMRSSGNDEIYNLVQHNVMNLEDMMDHIGYDECIESTPISLRMRKETLDVTARKSLPRMTTRMYFILEDET